MGRIRKPSYLVSDALFPRRATGALLSSGAQNRITWHETPDFSLLPDEVAAALCGKVYSVSMACSITAFSQSKTAAIQVGQLGRSSEGHVGDVHYPDTGGDVEYKFTPFETFEDYYEANFEGETIFGFDTRTRDPIWADFEFLETVSVSDADYDLNKSSMSATGAFLYYRKGETATEFGVGFAMGGVASNETVISEVSQGFNEYQSTIAYVTPGSSYGDGTFTFSVDVVDRWSITA